MKKNAHEQGFTLLELTIVIAVIGLIIGGVASGVVFMQTAKMNNTIADIKKYSKAMDNFQESFKSLPGDLAFTTTTIPFPDPRSVAAYPFGGDGNGNIDTTTVTNTRATPNFDTNESLQFWQHLVLANMLTGNFDGKLTSQYTPATGNGVGGVPAGSIEGSGFKISTDTVLGTVINFARFSSTASNLGILLPKDAFAIDYKIDDGNPLSGIVLGVLGGTSAAGSCYTGAGIWAEYVRTQTLQTCALRFVTSKKAVITLPTAINKCGQSPIGTSRVSLTKACPVGFTGDIIESCDVSGNWVVTRESCNIIKCSDEKTYLQTRELPCPENYSGQISQTCQLSGNWKNDSATPCTFIP